MMVCAVLLTIQVVAQEDKNLKAADQKFNNFNYVDARDIYLEVAKSGYQSENLFKRLGDSYYFNGQLTEALPWYESLYNYQKNVDKDYLFRYAMCLKSDKQYDKANKILEEYGQNFETQPVKYTKDDYLKIIELQSGRFEIHPVEINSKFSDFSPTYYLSKLVFASNRTDEKNPKLDPWTKKPFYDLYEVDLKRDNSFGNNLTKLPEPVNTLYHESSPVFSKDGKVVFFTRNNYNNASYKEDTKGTNLLKIYRSEKDAQGKWQTPIELSFNSDEYACAHPCLSPDEKYLYFSSNMPGGYGMSDLYRVAVNKDGSVGQPVNLGDKINTSQRESFPFITATNILYFASDGHYGLGGLDIFMTEFDEQDFSKAEVVNIGKPINSSMDDFSITIHEKDNTGYFASNRKEGSGDDDIYFLKQIKAPITGCKQNIKGYVTNENNTLNIPQAKVFLLDQSLNEIATTLTDQNGMYNFEVECNKNFVVRVSLSGYNSSEYLVNTGKDFEKENSVNLTMKKGGELGMTNIGIGTDLAKALQLDPIYFDFDKSYIRQDAEIELQKIAFIMKKNPPLKIDVRSHTDSRGEPDYNIRLSSDRAIATINYLVNQGIESNRISGKGYGDTQLINRCVKGVECTETEHELNRRSEFIIVSNTSAVIPVEIQSKKAVDTKNIETVKTDTFNKTYDFNTNEIIYTVQIGAFKQMRDIKLLPPNTYFYQYPDGYFRYFSGKFNTKAEAESYKLQLKSKNIDGFVVKLQGKNRQ